MLLMGICIYSRLVYTQRARHDTEGGFDALNIMKPAVWETIVKCLVATAVIFPVLIVVALLVAIFGALIEAKVDRCGRSLCENQTFNAKSLQ